MLHRIRKCKLSVLQAGCAGQAVTGSGGGAQRILIGLGGNLESARFGPPRETLPAALAAMEAEGIGIIARSGWYRSEPRSALEPALVRERSCVSGDRVAAPTSCSR